ncbi:MAG: PilZ domain-containing protein, partial [Candidatus Omnitrophica bacterium]|nr:PilZ domain-containing protein [Candidatus Omnitrophota bacterium]
KLSPNPELLELQARVVWIPDKAVQPHEYPGVGVEFSNLSSENQQRIIDFIERNISSMLSD